jgi:hypothetical protein
MVERKTSGFAIASLVLGIVWLGGIGSILAIIFGAVAKKQIKENKNLSGNGLANAGIVLGIISMGIGFLIVGSVLTVTWVNNLVTDELLDDTEYTNETGTGSDFDNLEILEHTLKSEGNEYFSVYYVEGTVKNIGDTQISYAQINARFFDTDKALMGNGFDNVIDIDSGMTYKFKVSYLGSGRPKTYDLSVSDSIF